MWCGIIVKCLDGVQIHQRYNEVKKRVRESRGDELNGSGIDSSLDMASEGALFEVLDRSASGLTAQMTGDSSPALHTKADNVPQRVSEPRLQRENVPNVQRRDKKRKCHFRLLFSHSHSLQ